MIHRRICMSADLKADDQRNTLVRPVDEETGLFEKKAPPRGLQLPSLARPNGDTGKTQPARTDRNSLYFTPN